MEQIMFFKPEDADELHRFHGDRKKIADCINRIVRKNISEINTVDSTEWTDSKLLDQVLIVKSMIKMTESGDANFAYTINEEVIVEMGSRFQELLMWKENSQRMRTPTDAMNFEIESLRSQNRMLKMPFWRRWLKRFK
jgi:hypothetical protein